jgi:hypothetical protein
VICFTWRVTLIWRRCICGARSLEVLNSIADVLRNSTDNDSFHYACAGKHIVRLIVHVFDKDVGLKLSLMYRYLLSAD